MFVHTVLFWLKPGLNPADRERFRAGLETLKQISSADAVYIGTPASTDRPVIDRSYDFGLTVMLKGLAEHDAYQVDPIHTAFVANCSALWERVLIYDFE